MDITLRLNEMTSSRGISQGIRLVGVVALKIESGGIILDNWFRTNGFCVCVWNYQIKQKENEFYIKLNKLSEIISKIW